MSDYATSAARDAAYWAGKGVSRPDPKPAATADKRGAFTFALKRCREARRISQSRLALDAGFTPSYVSRLELGTRTPTRDAVQRLAAALTLSPDDTERLMASAGFIGRDTAALLADEPALSGIAQLLTDATVPADLRDHVREDLVRLTELVRAGSWGGGAGVSETMAANAYRDAVSEADFQATIIELAERLGYLVYHNPDSRRSVAGYPDLHILGHGFSLFVELKSARGRVRFDQLVWIRELQRAGTAAMVIKPENADDLEALLRRMAAEGRAT